MNKQTIVKIGGSYFTDKSNTALIRPDDPGFAACFHRDKLAKCLTSLPEDVGGLVFGAGVYGHNLAVSVGLNSREYKSVENAVVIDIQQNLQRLQNELLSPLLMGVNWQSWPVADSHLRDLPVAYLPNLDLQENGVRIISGDEIVADLLRTGQFVEIVYYSDVPGVRAYGKLYDQFMIGDIEHLLAAPELQTLMGREDATGGMRGKLESLLFAELPDNLKISFRL